MRENSDDVERGIPRKGIMAISESNGVTPEAKTRITTFSFQPLTGIYGGKFNLLLYLISAVIAAIVKNSLKHRDF